MIQIKGKGRNVSLYVNGKRCGITIHAGPWIAGVDPATIKIRPKQYSFPAEVAALLPVENNSDSLTDYYERDCLRLLPGQPLYEQARLALG